MLRKLNADKAAQQAIELMKPCESIYYQATNPEINWLTSLHRYNQAIQLLTEHVHVCRDLYIQACWRALYTVNHLLNNITKTAERSELLHISTQYAAMLLFALKLEDEPANNLMIKTTMCHLMQAGRPKSIGYVQKLNKLAANFNKQFAPENLAAVLPTLTQHDLLDLVWCAVTFAELYYHSAKETTSSIYYKLALDVYAHVNPMHRHDFGRLFPKRLANDDELARKYRSLKDSFSFNANAAVGLRNNFLLSHRETIAAKNMVRFAEESANKKIKFDPEETAVSPPRFN